jgi:hypothetical protein
MALKVSSFWVDIRDGIIIWTLKTELLGKCAGKGKWNMFVNGDIIV